VDSDSFIILKCRSKDKEAKEYGTCKIDTQKYQKGAHLLCNLG